MKRLDPRRLSTVGYVRMTNSTRPVVGEMRGKGFFSDLKDKFVKKFLGNRPKIIQDIIDREGNIQVNIIEVCRGPIRSIFEKLLNAFSFGVLKEKMKERDYDKLFHLYVIIHLNNGSVYRIEKNQRMNVIPLPKKSETTRCLGMDVKNRNIDFKTFITAPEKVDMKDLYRYNAFEFNCQNYVKRLLNANGITKFDSFVLQKVKDLAPPFLQSIVRGITDTAGVIDYAIRGGELSDVDLGVVSGYEDILNSG